jgi:hypothetical protein
VYEVRPLDRWQPASAEIRNAQYQQMSLHIDMD